MKKNLLLMLFLLVSITSFAQSNYQDVVYLKDGSIIRGIIIEQVLNKSIKIQTADYNVFVYKVEEVEKLTKEPYKGKAGKLPNNILSNDDAIGLQVGYRGILELGYQIGVGSYGADRLKFNVINGCQFNPYFFAGIGTGLRYYLDADALVVPLFVDLRVNPLNQKLSPYFSLGIGYSFDASSDFEGVGLLINPSIGVSYKLPDKSVLNLGIGYEVQKMKYYISYSDYYGYYNYHEETKGCGAISINVGYSF